MNKSILNNLCNGDIGFPQFSFERLREARSVRHNRVLDMGVEIKDFKTDEREYSVSYWNNLRKPCNVRRVFKDKNKAIKFYDRANLILIDTPTIREMWRRQNEFNKTNRR